MKTKKIHKPVPASAAVKIGFAGGMLFTFSVLFFVMLGLMMNGYTLAQGNGLVENAIDAIYAQANTEAVPTTTPLQNVELRANDHVRGDAAAPVTIVEYSDFECPYCQKFHGVMQQLMEAYPGEVKWVYRHYPLEFHATAQMQAEASECVNALGGSDMFWTYTDLLFEQSEVMTEDTLATIAVAQGIDESAFRSCLTDGTYTTTVQTDLAEGTSVGVDGTPGNIIIAADGSQQLIAGAVPFESLAPIIDEALNK